MNENNPHNNITMLEFLAEVANYLRDLTEGNRKLLDALRKYQNHLIADDTAEIEKATPRLDRIAGEIRMQDEKRRAYVDDFFTMRGWGGPRNFSAITEHVKQTGINDEEAAMYEQAASARMELIEILAEVDAQNSLNLTLIGQSMSFAELSLRALLGLDSNNDNYGPSELGDEPPSFLDAQA